MGGSTSNKIVGAIIDPIGLMTGGKMHSLAGISNLYRYEKDTSEPDPASVAAEKAAKIEQAAKEAEAQADAAAKEAARKKLAQQTRTIFTSALGTTGTTKTKKAILGSN